MALFGLKIPKKINDVFGATQRGLSRSFDQVNPFDAGRTWQQRTPTNTRSGIGQLTHNGITNTAGNIFVKPVANTISASIIEPGRSIIGDLTNNRAAMQAAETRKKIAMQGSLPGMGLRTAGNIINLPITSGRQVVANITGNQLAESNASADALRSLNATPLGGLLSMPQRALAGRQVRRDLPELSPEQQQQATAQNIESVGLDPTASLGKQFLETGVSALELYGTARAPQIVRNPVTAVTDPLDVLKAGKVKVQNTAKSIKEGNRQLAGNEAGFVTVGRTPKKIHPEDQAVMADLVDMQRGVYKPDPKTAYNLELDASRIAERYGMKMPPTLKGLANEFDKRLQTEGFGTKKGVSLVDKVKANLKPLDEEGFVGFKKGDEPAYMRGRPQSLAEKDFQRERKVGLPIAKKRSTEAERAYRAKESALRDTGEPAFQRVPKETARNLATTTILRNAEKAPASVKKELDRFLATPGGKRLVGEPEVSARVKVTSKVVPEPPETPTAPKVAPEAPAKVIVRPAKNGVAQEVKRGLSDQDQVILDELRNLDKQNPVPKGEPSRVDRFMYNSNMQRGSNARANVILQTSENVQGALGKMNKREARDFSDYANARTELASAMLKGKATGGKVKVSRPLEELRATVTAGDNRFNERFEKMNQHYKELAKVWHEAGVIDDATFNRYTKNNDYIRLQRDMDDKLPSPYGAGNGYQLGSTQAKQKRKGSTRATLDAGEVLAERTQQVYREAARNKTGTHLVDNLTQNGLARKVSAKKATNLNTVSIFRGGKKEFYEVSPQMKQAMDNINPYHMNVVMRILAAPGRVLRAGVTGLNPVFIARNLIKDQFGSAINSKHMRATHNPKTFFNGIFQASKDAAGFKTSPAYKEFLKHYGDQTSYDLTRNVKDTKAVMNRIRGGKREGIKQSLSHPIRSLENVAAVTEKSTRFQNFIGEYRKAIKQGLSKEQASERAAMAAWQNSVDFSRAGTWGRVINTVLPYWNPATQGVRQMGRTLKDRPVKSVFAGTALVGVPLVAATAWNIQDKDTREVWDNIPEYEKDNNIILIPPGTKQNKDGSYDVVKIPLPPGYKDVFMPLRRAFESFSRDKPQEGIAMAQDILTALTGPVQTRTGQQFIGSFIPQIAKPGIQQGMNKDLFTGKDIVPEYMNEALDASGNPIPESKKAYKEGSGTAQKIAEAIGVSPIRVEKFIKDTAGTVGLNVLNAADNVLTPDKVGGQSVAGGFKRSFATTQGVENFNKSEGAKYFDRVKKAQEGLNSNEKSAFDALHPAKKNFLGEQIYEHDATYDPAARLDIYNRFPKVYEADKKLDQQNRQQGKPGNPMFDLEQWQLKKVLEKENLPPGAKDPELSNLYTQDWYADYRTKKTNFFSKLKAQADKEGKPFGSNDNPYPETPPNVQKAMDMYSSLPKGTGARSSWIRGNPGLWAAMQKQFALTDNWQNIARGKRGLDMTEGAEGIAAGYGSGSGGFGGGRTSVFNPATFLKKYSVGGGNIPSGYSGSTGKVTVKAKPRSSGSGKVTVKRSKIRLA